MIIGSKVNDPDHMLCVTYFKKKSSRNEIEKRSCANAAAYKPRYLKRVAFECNAKEQTPHGSGNALCDKFIPCKIEFAEFQVRH